MLSVLAYSEKFLMFGKNSHFYTKENLVNVQAKIIIGDKMGYIWKNLKIELQSTLFNKSTKGCNKNDC